MALYKAQKENCTTNDEVDASWTKLKGGCLKAGQCEDIIGEMVEVTA